MNSKSLIFASLVMAANVAIASDVDFSKGVFIVNEDWFGHNNSTLNYLDADNENGDYWHYRVFQTENPGYELGCTAEFATIYNGRIYILSKQEKDGGASITGGRITIADAKTLQVIWQSTTISTDGSQADSRAFVGINASKGYVSTSGGIWIVDLDNLCITGKVTDPDNLTNKFCDEQSGTMVAVGNKVFAANQHEGVFVIDTDTDQIVDVISMDIVSKGAGIGSIVQSKDGMLWLSVAEDKTGSGSALPYIVKLNPSTLATKVIAINNDLYAPTNSWYAWTPDAFCASSQTNTLYWKGAESRWFDGGKIFKYDIDRNEQSLFIDLDSEDDGWKVYGCSMRVHPQTDELYMSLYKSYGNTSYTVRRYDNSGSMVKEYPMEANYWFPAVPFFPEAIADTSVNDITCGESTADIYNLSGILIARNVDLAQKLNLAPGIYIARTGNTSRKLLVK